MKYVLVSGGMFPIPNFMQSKRARSDRFTGVISGIGKGTIGMYNSRFGAILRGQSDHGKL